MKKIALKKKSKIVKKAKKKAKATVKKSTRVVTKSQDYCQQRVGCVCEICSATGYQSSPWYSTPYYGW